VGEIYGSLIMYVTRQSRPIFRTNVKSADPAIRLHVRGHSVFRAAPKWVLAWCCFVFFAAWQQSVISGIDARVQPPVTLAKNALDILCSLPSKPYGVACQES